MSSRRVLPCFEPASGHGGLVMDGVELDRRGVENKVIVLVCACATTTTITRPKNAPGRSNTVADPALASPRPAGLTRATAHSANRRRLSFRGTGLQAPQAKRGASSTAAARPFLFPHLTLWAPLVRNPPPPSLTSQSVSYPSHSFLGPKTFVLTGAPALHCIAHTPTRLHIHIHIHVHTYIPKHHTLACPHDRLTT
jgi:hypothetical protein